MREIIRKFTMGHTKQMIEPAIWHFLEGFTMTFPAIAVYFVINLLIEHFENPERIFDKGYWNIALWMLGLFLLQLIVSTFSFLRTFLSNQRSIRTKSATNFGTVKYGDSVGASWQTAPRHY